MVQIERPSLELFESFSDFVAEMQSHNEPLWAPYLPKEQESASDFIERLLRRSQSPQGT